MTVWGFITRKFVIEVKISTSAMMVSLVKVICFLNQIALPLSYMGLNLACIVQLFLHGGTILGHRAFPGGAGESPGHRLPPSSLTILA